jgi:hypothetical protein
MATGFKAAATAMAASFWGVFSEFVTPCYYFTPGPVNQGKMECIIRPVPARFVDGADVKAGDSVVLIPAAQMASVPNPAAGDYLLTLGGEHRWDVLSGQLDASQVLVRLIVRRAY